VDPVLRLRAASVGDSRVQFLNERRRSSQLAGKDVSSQTRRRGLILN
jgi:hypothetical protein